MYQNPAVLSFMRTPGVLLNQRYSQFERVFQENIAARIFANRVHAFGLGMGVEHSGKLWKNTLFNFLQFDVDAAYSFKIPEMTQNLSFGILGDFRMGKDDSLASSAAQVSVGLFYAPATGPSYSLIYRGLGKTITYTSTRFSGQTVTSSQIEDSPRSIEIGSTMKFPDSGRPYLIISVAGERDLISKEFRVKGGIETIVLNTLSLRVGYVKAEAPQLRYGAALSISRFSLEYATMPWEQPGWITDFTLKFAF
jgi:hypothetical protein